MKKTIYISLSAIFLLLSGFVYLAIHSITSAQSASQGLEISPPSQEITVDPGKTITVKAKINNKGTNKVTIAARVEDFTAKGNDGQIELLTNSPYSIISWTTIDTKSFTLAPGTQKEVTATVKVPKTAAGGHFGAIVFKTQAGPSKTSTTVSQEIASLFLLKVTGTVQEKLQLQSLHAPAYSEFGPIPLTMNFANSGNVHVKTYGLINVTDMFGKKVADIVVPGVNVFPNANRAVQATLDKQFLFGKYTATALMYYGDSGQQTETQETTFIVFPTRIALGGLAFFFILYLLRKRFAKALKALFGK